LGLIIGMGTDCKSALSYIRDFLANPSDRILDNPNLKKILDWARKNNKTWNFGGLDNGIMLQKRTRNIIGEIVGDHANHPNYNKLINEEIGRVIFNPTDMEDSFDELIKFTNNLKDKINKEVINGGSIINDMNIK
jgi:hypothetical protein